jgi:hypothetical protein
MLSSVKDSDIGIVIYKHPTKGVARVMWSIAGFSWDSCGRLKVVNKCYE